MTDEREKKIIRFLKETFRDVDHSESRDLIKQEKILRIERKKLYTKYIKTFDLKLNKVINNIRNKCTHPNIEVIVNSWYDNDGEGNSWRGSYFNVTCPNCGYTQVYDRSNEKYDVISKWYIGTGSFGQKREIASKLTDFEAKLDILDNKTALKQKEIDDEKQEREQYERLKEKYGS